MPLTACSFSSVALIVWFQGIYCFLPPCGRHTNQPGSELNDSEVPFPAAALLASATSTSRGAARRPSSPQLLACAGALRRWGRVAPAGAGAGGQALAPVAQNAGRERGMRDVSAGRTGPITLPRKIRDQGLTAHIRLELEASNSVR